jgi:2-keto-4-pentenoate hydratase
MEAELADVRQDLVVPRVGRLGQTAFPEHRCHDPRAVADERITRGMAAQLADARRSFDRDERPLGWKLGFGTDAAMQKLGIDAPLVGYLPTANRLESGAIVDISNWGNPKLEPEIVARAGEKGEITAIGAAIELVDLDTSVSDPEEILGGNIFQRHVLLSPVTEGATTDDVVLKVVVEGEEVAAADDVTEATGAIDGLVKHVAKTLKAVGEELERGDVVICGSIVPALDVEPGQTVEVRLEPLGSLTVSFE